MNSSVTTTVNQTQSRPVASRRARGRITPKVIPAFGTRVNGAVGRREFLVALVAIRATGRADLPRARLLQSEGGCHSRGSPKWANDASPRKQLMVTISPSTRPSTSTDSARNTAWSAGRR